MKTDVLVSFIIPVYNAQTFLQECVESITKQDNGKIEVILVDDGSTDDSFAVCRNLQSKYPQIIRALHQENQGSMAARLHGVKAATGEYLQFVDADDYLILGAVEKICKDADAKADIYLYDEIIEKTIGGSSEYLSPFGTQEKIVFDEHNCFKLYRVFMEGKLNSMCFGSYKKTLFDQIDLLMDIPKVRNGEDRLLKMFLLLKAKKVEYIPYGYYYYRYTPGSQGGALRNGILTEESYRDFQITWPIERAHYADMHFTKEEANEYDAVKLSWLMALLEKSNRERISGVKSFEKLLKTVSSDELFSELAVNEITDKLRQHNRISVSLLRMKKIKCLRVYWALCDALRKIKRVV